MQQERNNLATTLQPTPSENAISSHITTAIYMAIERVTGISSDKIHSSNRKEEIVNARQMAVALFHHLDIQNHSRIARELHKSHTAIAKIMQNHEAMMMINRAYRSTYRTILPIVQAQHENDSLHNR